MDDRAMSREYWDLVSANYEEEITSVFHRDTEGLICSRIAEAGEHYDSGRAADIGCGVGNFIPALAKAFKNVDACDWSEVGLLESRKKSSEFGNTHVCSVDLSEDEIPFDLVDFALCVNVLIMPDLDDRLTAWRAVTNQINSDGSLLLVVPSHESAQMELYHGLELRLSEGDRCSDAVRLVQHAEASASDLQLGVFSVNGTRTKHYLKAELRMMLASHEFDVSEIVRIVYPVDNDEGLSESWDWLVVANRR